MISTSPKFVIAGTFGGAGKTVLTLRLARALTRCKEGVA